MEPINTLTVGYLIDETVNALDATSTDYDHHFADPLDQWIQERYQIGHPDYVVTYHLEKDWSIEHNHIHDKVAIIGIKVAPPCSLDQIAQANDKIAADVKLHKDLEDIGQDVSMGPRIFTVFQH